MGKRPVNEEERTAPAKSQRAVFLDRDGVINQPKVINGRPYPPLSIDEFILLPGVTEACAKLKQQGFLLIVATNQPDVGRGTLKLETVEAIHEHLRAALPIDRIEACYHPGRGASNCECRKPKPGMLQRAARELNIDLSRSWMVGDRWRDIDCGHAAGCRTILIDYGYDEPLKQLPDFRASNLLEAAGIILKG